MNRGEIAMQPIPMPEVLDPDRVSRDEREGMTAEDHRSQAELLDKALHETCDYARTLWDHLDANRAYLLDSLPPDPRIPGKPTTAGASPTGPDDDDGWQHWITAFSRTTSALCGPRGDSGFGLSQAREAAQVRRSAPVLTLPTSGPPAAADDGARPAGARDLRTRVALRAAAAIALGAIAVRALRPHRG
jgi:hypothetical protein